MTLFPYAKDIEYSNQELSFVLQFFDNAKVTDVSITIGLDEDLSLMIENLMGQEV